MSVFHPKRTLSTNVRNRPIAVISRLSQISGMDSVTIKIMRASLWSLFAAASAVSIFWALLLLTSGFEIWRESNGAGLSIQTLLLVFPVALFAGLKKSADNSIGTVATFLVGWSAAVTALLFFNAL